MTTFDDYQEETDKTAIYPEAGSGTLEALTYVVLGLCGEAGEVASVMKRVYRDDDGAVTVARLEQLKKEIGDVLWYIARACTELDFDLDDVAVTNIERLLQRKKHGTLKNEGDDR